MKKPTVLALTLALSAPLLATTAATAHDDGLTCHSHPTAGGIGELSFNFIEIESTGGTGKTLAADLLGHALDNRVAANRELYNPQEVVALHASLGELEEMVGAVRRLVDRATRIDDPVETDRAFGIAEDTLDRLPLGKYLTIDDFRQEQRYAGSVVVKFEVLAQYLSDVGTSGHLIAAVEDAAAGC